MAPPINMLSVGISPIPHHTHNGPSTVSKSIIRLTVEIIASLGTCDAGVSGDETLGACGNIIRTTVELVASLGGCGVGGSGGETLRECGNIIRSAVEIGGSLSR